MMWLGFLIAYLGIGWDTCRRDREDIIEAASDWRWTVPPPASGKTYTVADLRSRQIRVVDRQWVTVEIITRLVCWPAILTYRAAHMVWRRWVDYILRRWTS